jgi:hypothetical protein
MKNSITIFWGIILSLLIFNPFLGFAQENQDQTISEDSITMEESYPPEIDEPPLTIDEETAGEPLLVTETVDATIEEEDEQLIQTPLTLASLSIESKGSVNHWFVLQRIKKTLYETQVFDNEEHLRDQTASAVQSLLNYRIYKSVDSKYTLNGDQASITLLIEDSWNLIPLPFAIWDTEKGGLVLGGIMIWNNFAGTTTDLRTSYGYTPEDWLTLEGVVDPVYSDFQLEWDRLFWESFRFKFSLRSWFKTESIIENNVTLAKYQYLFNSLGLSWGVSMDFWPEWLDFMNGLSYNQSVGYKQNVDLNILEENPLDLSYPDTGPQVGFSHGLGDGEKDWIGNFHVGWGWGLGQSMYWDFERNELIQNFSASFNLAEQWDWFGYKWRLDLGQGLQNELRTAVLGCGGSPMALSLAKRL